MKNKNKNNLIAGIVIAVLIIAVVLISISPKQEGDEETIKIGFITPLTGPFADWGESIKYGLELGLEDTNHKFSVDYQDSACDPKETVTIAQKFFNLDNIKIIIGPGCVSGLRAIAPMADKKNALLFSTGLLDDAVFEEYSSVLNFATQISTEADYMAEFMKSINLKKVAIVHSTNYFGQEYAKRLPESLEEKGIEISSINPTDLDLMDFRTVILKIKKDNPDAIFIDQGEIQIGLFAKQLKELDYSIPLYGYYGIESPSVLESGGKALEGLIYTFPYNNAKDSEGEKDFEKRYEEKYNEIPTATSLFTYDGILLIDKALEECNEKDTDCIKDFFINLGIYEGLSGKMKFNKDGSLDREFVIKTIKGGKFVEYSK